MRKTDGLGRTRVSKYLPLGPNGDQSPILSVHAGRGERGRVTFLSPSQASGSLSMTEAEAVSFSRVCYLKISVSLFLVTLVGCWAGRESRLHSFYVLYNPWESAPSFNYVCLWNGTRAMGA